MNLLGSTANSTPVLDGPSRNVYAAQLDRSVFDIIISSSVFSEIDFFIIQWGKNNKIKLCRKDLVKKQVGL